MHRSYKKIGIYLLASVLSVLLLVMIMRLWKSDPTVSFGYEGDGLYHSEMIKGIIDNGWYLENDKLGAPFGMDFHGYPFADFLNFSILKGLALATKSWALTFNLFFILTFPLVTLTALFVFLRLKINSTVAVVMALLYTYVPYHLMRGEGHLFLSAYYMVPLLCWLALNVFEENGYLFLSDSISWKTLNRKNALLTAVLCLLAGSTGVYYAFFGMILIFFAGLIASLNNKRKAHIISAVLIAAFIGLVSFLNVLPNFLSPAMHVKSGGALRLFGESDVYGLKLIQLILPRSNHNIAFLAKLKQTYNLSAPLVTENDISSLGVIAAIGFLCSLAAIFLGRFNPNNLYKKIGALNLGAVLLSTIGGFAFFVTYFVTTQIRAYNRISIFIAFFSLLLVAQFLSNLHAKHIKTQPQRILFALGLGVLLLAGLYDQVPDRWTSYLPYQHKVAQDKEFFSAVQAKLEKGAMVFQLPYVPFPEWPPVNKLKDYEHFRGYLNTDGVKWSYGAFKGSDADTVIKFLSQQTGPEFVDNLVAAGYSGIYINRLGYADAGAAVERRIQAVIKAEPQTGAKGEMVFYNLNNYKSELPEKARNSLKEKFENLEERALGVYYPGEWITQDDDKRLVSGWSTNEGTHRWSDGTLAKVDFKLKTIDPKRGMTLVVEPKMVLGRQQVEMLLNQEKIAEFLFDAPKEYTVDFSAALLKSNALNELSFKLPDAALPGGTDPRMLAIALGKIGFFYADGKGGAAGRKSGAHAQKAEPLRVVSEYTPGTWITQDSGQYLPSGWSTNEETHRWSEGHVAKIEFKLKSLEKAGNLKLIIVPKMVLGSQHAEITVNDQKVDTVLFKKPKEYVVKVNTVFLKPNATNVICINLPDAVAPSGTDKRLLAIALGQIGLFY